MAEEGTQEERPVSPESRSPEQAQIRQIVQAQIAQSFSGPLPPPDVLNRYNDAVPNGAERIMAMAEKQADHRMGLEKQVITADIQRANWGLGAGLTVALAFLVVSTLLVLTGHEEAGVVLGTFDIVGLVGVFVYGSLSRRKEREERIREMIGEGESS